MTDGTSQGLFIVVAIVIFGIFVVLAYILFEDTLSPAMASMFHTAIEKTTMDIDNLNAYIARKDSDFVTSGAERLNPENNSGVYKLKWTEGYSGSWGDSGPIGLRPYSSEWLKLKWGEKITVSMDIVSSVDAVFTVDFNANFLDRESGNDFYGSTNSNTGSYTKKLKANQKTNVKFFLVNDNETLNPQKLDIYEYSVFGIQNKFLMNGEIFEISNIRYLIE